MSNQLGASPLTPTPSQTVGPFFHLGLSWLFDTRVADADAPGQHISVQGRILDGDRAPVPDAVLEVWQADANGLYVAPVADQRVLPARNFRGCARCPTDELGAFQFSTVRPGRVPPPESGIQAPHLSVQIFMRGLLRPLLSRIYFADERANLQDLVLGRVPESRRHTLLARPRADQRDVFEWNVMLQGPDETVFFDA